jgi:PAS domain S-box-containing protein
MQGKLGERPVRVAAVRDVTERERTQALLSETEARMRSLVESAFDLTVFSRQGTVVEVAGACLDVLGYTREQMIGQHIMKFTSPRAASVVTEKLNEQRTGFYLAEGVAASGELVPLEIVGVDSSLNGQPVRVSAMRDLRAQKRLEEDRLKLQRDLERSQRMESLGVLAGGIAHDFNNLLMGVMGCTELLKTRLRDALDQELLQGIMDAGQRAATLTAQLLAYAGRKELGPRVPIDLAALLSELRVLLDASLSKKARVSLLTDERCVVLGNRATLTQVAMNLLTNASDALLDQPGNVTVRLQRVAQPDFRFSSLPAPPSAAGWILLEVSDTGCGMDEATQARIFEPFFTTKLHGHGLGLAACMGIASSHGGALHVESTPGLGSTFSMLLPAHEAEPPPPPRISYRPPAGDLRVLVVDDEPLIRSQLRHALRLRGYRVEEASNGAQALALLVGEAAQPFAIIILDVTMPDHSGIEVLRQVRASGSEVPIVLSSGYHDAALDLDRASYQGFLIKPYTLSQLFEVLHTALERNTPGPLAPPLASRSAAPP